MLMRQDFSSPNSLQFAESAFRRLFSDPKVSRDSIIHLIDKLKTGKLDGRSSSSCVMCYIGEYLTPTQSFEVGRIEYVFSNKIMPKKTQKPFLKATRHFTKGVSQVHIPWLQTIESFASLIHMNDTPRNNTYANKLLQWAQDSLKQKNEDQSFLVENLLRKELSLM